MLASEGWFIANVHVTVPTTGARYHFPCQRWLARDRGDRKLVVEFIPSSVQEFGMFVCQLIRFHLVATCSLIFAALGTRKVRRDQARGARQPFCCYVACIAACLLTFYFPVCL